MKTLWESVIARAAETAVDLWIDTLSVVDDDEEMADVVDAVKATAVRTAERWGASCWCEEDEWDIADAVMVALEEAGF